MQQSAKLLSIIIVTFFGLCGTAYSQDVKEGTIKYEKHIYYEWSSLRTGDPARDNFITNLPTAKNMGMILYFNKAHSLYEQDMSVVVAGVSESQQSMLLRLSNREAPRPETKKVYFDFRKDRKTVIIELLTRYFLVEDKTDNQSWKPGTGQKKILDYLCMDATMKRGDQTVTAWFAPGIPVSVGPENYYGLPGLILAVEIDGKNIFLATSVEKTSPKAESIVKPKDGTAMSQKEFDEILAQKTAEWSETMKKRAAGSNARN